MAKNETLTKSDFLKGIKELKSEFDSKLKKQSEDLKGFFYDTLASFELDEINPKLDAINNRLEKLEYEIYFLKREIKDLTMEFSQTPSKKDVSILKERIQELESELKEIKIKIGLAN